MSAWEGVAKKKASDQVDQRSSDDFVDLPQIVTDEPFDPKRFGGRSYYGDDGFVKLSPFHALWLGMYRDDRKHHAEQEAFDLWKADMMKRMDEESRRAVFEPRAEDLLKKK